MNSSHLLARVAIIAVFFLMLFIGVVNFVVDPDHVRDFEVVPFQYKHLPTMSARSKLGILAKKKCERVIIGTSRAEFAFDPSDPRWDALSTCNIGISAATIDDQIYAAKMVLHHGVAREVLWAFDFFSFNSFVAKKIKKENFFEDFSWQRSKQSYRVLLNVLNDNRNGYTTEGHLALPPFTARAITRFRIDIRQFLGKYSDYARFSVSGSTYSDLQAVITDIAKSGIKVKAIVLPVHPVHLEIMRKLGLREQYDLWMSSLILTQSSVQDFTSYNFPNTETLPSSAGMLWFWDSQHITKRYGALITGELTAQRSSFATMFNSQEEYQREALKREGARIEWVLQNELTLKELGLQ